MTNSPPKVIPAPSVTEIERIAAMRDAELRNLLITQSYHELSAALAQRTGASANWCTFATWASKQAGQSIRKEDLRRTLENALLEAPEPSQAAAQVANQVQLLDNKRSLDEVIQAVWQTVDFRLSIDRVAEAVARGNKKVFEEIGREFARFLAEFQNDNQPDKDRLDHFLTGLRPGNPPEGQGYLRRAFTRYYRALFITDAKQRAEQLLTANIEIGVHEQTRLQPEIAEALDAAFVNITQITRRIILFVFPFSGWLYTSMGFGRKMLRRATMLEQAIQTYRTAVQIQMRRCFTDMIMTLRFPPDTVVRLGDDLRSDFPETLRHLTDLELLSLLASLDPTPDSLNASGAGDWAYLPDRLHFITDLFRCYQESPGLFEAPFSLEHTLTIKNGRKPSGRL